MITVVLNQRERCSSCSSRLVDTGKTCERCKTRSRNWKREKRAEWHKAGLSSSGLPIKRNGWKNR